MGYRGGLFARAEAAGKLAFGLMSLCAFYIFIDQRMPPPGAPAGKEMPYLKKLRVMSDVADQESRVDGYVPEGRSGCVRIAHAHF